MNKKKILIPIYVEISIFQRSHMYIIEIHTSMLTEFSPRNFLQNYMEYVMNESRIKEKISTLQILKTCSKSVVCFPFFLHLVHHSDAASVADFSIYLDCKWCPFIP